MIEYDVENGLYNLNNRYYNPEIGRFISPDSIDNIDPSAINGLNLYRYCNNNPITVAYSSFSNVNNDVMPFLNQVFNSNFSTITAIKNYWNPHWKNEWFVTNSPSLFVLSDEGFKLFNMNFSIYRGSLHFDNIENRSIYISAGNVEFYVGADYKKGIGINASASMLQIGYDGRFIDARLEGLSVGVTYMYKEGKFEFGYGASWFDWSISIDFAELLKFLIEGD